jgi:hypothetical protein
VFGWGRSMLGAWLSMATMEPLWNVDEAGLIKFRYE